MSHLFCLCRRSLLILSTLVTSSALFNLVVAAPPTNDDFADAILLSGSFDTASSSTVDATREEGEPSWAGSSATTWFRWRAPDDGRITLQVIDDGLDHFRLTIWQGTNFANLTALASINDGFDAELPNFPVAKDTLYYFSVGMYSSSTSDRDPFEIAVVLHTDTDINSLNVRGAPYNNDVFNRAFDLGVEDGTVISYGFDTVVNEAGEPSRNMNRTTWFKYVAPEDGTLRVTATGSDIHNPSDNNRHFEEYADKSLVAYQVETFAEMVSSTPVRSSNVGGGLPGPISFSVDEGLTYYVCTGVSDSHHEYRDYSWRVTSFSFSASPPPPPPPEVNPHEAIVRILAFKTVKFQKKIRKVKKKKGSKSKKRRKISKMKRKIRAILRRIYALQRA